MKRLFNVFILAIVLLYTGCATPYQKLGLSGGYEDAHIKDNIYFVHVAVNIFTGPIIGAKYLHWRAKEVCEENGYQDYRITQAPPGSTQPPQSDTAFASSSGAHDFSVYVECLKTSK
jgi:hypothetical protein